MAFNKRGNPSSQNLKAEFFLLSWRLQTHFPRTMQFSAPLITLLVSTILTTALPTGISFGKNLKTAVAQKRTQEHKLATSNSPPEKKRAYRLEIVEVAALNFKRDLKPTALEGRNAQSKQAEERPTAVGNRFDPNFHPGHIVENYEDALDVKSPGYVGLGHVLETLD